MLAFLQNEFWFLRYLLLFFCLPFLSSIICASDFSCLSLSLVDSQISYPSVFDIFTLLSSRDLKFSMYKILLVILTAPKCCSSISVPFCMAWNHYFFTWANQKYMSCFLSYIQLITRSHKSIDFTFSLRTFRPTFLPGVLSFSHYFNTGIPFWAMDSFS